MSYPAHQPRRLRRSRNDRWIGGVCGGLAEYLNMDATLVRVGVVIIALVTAAVPVAAIYLLMMLLIPEADTQRPGSSARRPATRGSSPVGNPGSSNPGSPVRTARRSRTPTPCGVRRVRRGDRTRTRPSTPRHRNRRGRARRTFSAGPSTRRSRAADRARRRLPTVIRKTAVRAISRRADHSHSMVAGGLLVMSRVTRLISRT
ncbi:PspC domain-containing protein [Microlunatus endophyticus]